MNSDDQQNSSDGSLDSSLEKRETAVESSQSDSSASIKPKKSFFKKIQTHVSRINIYFLLFIFVVCLMGMVTFVSYKQNKKDAAPVTIDTTPLDTETLKQLKSSDASVGDAKSTLSIESNAIFSGKVLVKDSLDVAGTLRVGGALSLPGITVSGQSSFDQIQANNLAISGDTSIQGQLTVQKNITVSGNASISGSITASRLSVDNFTLNQDIQLNRHIDAGGPTPSKVDGSALGGGGTSSVNGTDTAGSVTINTGSGPVAGCMVTVRFAQRFSGTPHVVITPVGLAAASLQYYITRTSSEFNICTATPAVGSASFGFDYVAID